jgi:hypothetical protein
MQAQYRTIVRPERLSWVKKVLKTRTREARLEVMREAAIFLAQMVEK